MSRDTEKLITLATFGSATEAALARGRLHDAGIPASLDGDLTANTLWHVGTALGGVKLLVAAADAEQAARVLGLFGDDSAEGIPTAPWTCPQCGETVDAGFALCWSCGATPDAEPTFRPPSETPTATATPCPMCGSPLPAGHAPCRHCGERAPTAPVPTDDEDAPDPAADHLRRAWNAAVFGIIALPPLLSLYSALQLARYHRLQADNGRPKHWRAMAAFWINAIIIVGSVLFWGGLGLFPALNP